MALIKPAVSSPLLKHRLFVDMDGTLAEFKPVDRLETLYEPGYFGSLPPMDSVVEAIQMIQANHPEIEVHILSAYLSDSPYALTEKNQWLDQHLPGIDAAHRIFVPCGESKMDAVEDIRETDYLLDDYTKNLAQWGPPARGIKLLNGINHTNGIWQGDRLSFDQAPEDLATKIVAIMQGRTQLRELSPQEALAQAPDSHVTPPGIVPKLAAFLIQEGTLRTGSGSWAMSFEKIKERFGVTISPDNSLGKDLMEVLSNAVEVSDVEMTNTDIDMTYYLDFCNSLDEDEDLEM